MRTAPAQTIARTDSQTIPQQNNRVEQFRVRDLRIHPRAQRDIKETKVKEIMSKLDLDAIGVLKAVQYERDGVMGIWVIDGQHRLEALKRYGFEDWEVLVEIIVDCKDDVRAHELFLLHNKALPPVTWDRFKNEVGAKQSEALGMLDAVSKNGFHVGNSASLHQLACVTALRRAYRFDRTGKILDKSLAIALSAWGRVNEITDGRLIEGLGRVLNTNPTLDVPNLIAKLSKYPSGPKGVIRDALGLSAAFGGSAAMKVEWTIVQAYNQSKREENRIRHSRY
jgi:hypothetical protein